jgi:hypothetical protein
MDDAILTPVDDLEALFQDEGEDHLGDAATGGSKPDTSGNPK